MPSRMSVRRPRNRKKRLYDLNNLYNATLRFSINFNRVAEYAMIEGADDAPTKNG